MSQLKLTCLYNADDKVVGWFNDYGVDLGGPADAASVLYVLEIKAPR